MNEIDVEVKPGIRRIHHNVERDPVVIVFPLTDENEIYLVSQYRYNLERDVLEAVAGYIEPNETPLEAAKRELAEEAGLTGTQWRELGSEVQLGSGVMNTSIYLFVAKGLTLGDTNFDESEDITLHKMPFKTAIDKVISGEINILSSMVGLLLIDKLQQEGKL